MPMSDSSISSDDEDLLNFQPFASQDTKATFHSEAEQTQTSVEEYDQKEDEPVNDEDDIRNAVG